MSKKEKQAVCYAIVDIETTGGQPSASAITDIAIFIHNGHEVIDQYESLVKPNQKIPPFIQNLTGITNEMVADSPTFDSIAADIFNILDGKIFVAHNVNFDYSFVKEQLQMAGYSYNASRLCTVRLSRKIFPGYPSYSLGKLCAQMGITIENRHRAGGDAQATTILFDKILKSGKHDIINAMLERSNSKEQMLPANLPIQEYKQLPTAAGVYYMLDKKGKPIYIGKALNIKKRVAQHFSGLYKSARKQHLLNEVYHITFEICATELMAFLLEATEIKHFWPKYNDSLKLYEPKYGLFSYEDQNGYKRLTINKLKRGQTCMQQFSEEEQGRNLLHHLVRDFSLCPEKCMLGTCKNKDFCDACCESSKAQADIYNDKVTDALQHIDQYLPTYLIIDKGRHESEKSIIYVENGQFYGMGYVDSNGDITNFEEIKETLNRYQSFPYMTNLINFYEGRHKIKKTYLKELYG